MSVFLDRARARAAANRQCAATDAPADKRLSHGDKRDIGAESRSFGTNVPFVRREERIAEDSVDDFKERVAIIEANGVPREWAEAFAHLDAMARPSGVAAWRWVQIVDDAGGFLDRWGREAAALRWSALDVFGVNIEAPLTRTDCIGLAVLIEGGAVVRIAKDSATIRSPRGAVLTYRRRPLSEAGPVWSLRHSDHVPS